MSEKADNKMAKEYAYCLDCDKSPILYVNCDENFTIETQNAFGGDIHDANDLDNLINSKLHHPLSGPIYINGVNPGDSIEITVMGIKPHNVGYQCLSSSSGVLNLERFTRNLKIVQLNCNNRLIYDKYEFDAQFSIGVVGTATKKKTRSGRTGLSGGNIDIKEFGLYSKIILPCEYEGGLLYVGDMHLLQGNGEISGVAVESSGIIQLRVSISKIKYNFPILFLNDDICFLGYGESIREAVACATKNAITYICNEYSTKHNDAYMLLGIIGNITLGHATGKIVSCGVNIGYKNLDELKKQIHRKEDLSNEYFN